MKRKPPRRKRFAFESLREDFVKLDEDQLKLLKDRGLDDIIFLLQNYSDVFENLQARWADIDEGTESRADDLGSALKALLAMRDSLDGYIIPSKAIERLMMGLGALAAGASPPLMFSPRGSAQRPPDAHSVQAAKGSVAAMAYIQQKRGRLSRKQAAEWAVKNISPSLTVRISRKPITPRTVIEWIDRYGGKTAEDSPGREHFRATMRTYMQGELTSGDQFRVFTEDNASRLPSLAPANKKNR